MLWTHVNGRIQCLPLYGRTFDICAFSFLTLFEFFIFPTTTRVHPVKLGAHLERVGQQGMEI